MASWPVVAGSMAPPFSGTGLVLHELFWGI
jgi:hypothetical protein